MLNNQPDRKPGRHHDDAVVKRVSRKHEDDDHGGAWKVAFADFCLALMCLFLVLWVMAARQQERIQEVLRTPGTHAMDEGQGIMPESLGGPRGSLIAREPLPHRGNADDERERQAPRRRYESAADLQELAQALIQLSSEAGLAANLQALVMPYGLRVMLHDTEGQGMFERGSAVPSVRFQKLLRRMGPLFARMENQMLVVGHTDSLPYADRRHAAFSNWTLSTHRAMSARTQLLDGGMAADGFLQVVGMADRAPIESRNAAADVNRRIELLILTPRQAQTIASLFGRPAQVQLLSEDVDSALPDAEALKLLRDQLARQGGGAHAQ